MRLRITGSTRFCGCARHSLPSSGWYGCVTLRLRNARLPTRFSFRGVVDLVAAVAVPAALISGANPNTAWLLAIVWLLKLVPGIPGLRQLRRVLVVESGPLLSVLVIFLMVVFMASVAEYYLEREAQPTTFGSVPAALWWAVVTMTTVGYGDVVPVTPLGRLVAAMVMISGLGVFGLWTGILATGFAAETRRDNFLKTWESVSKVPFFAALGPAAIADVTNMLRTMDLPPRTMIIRKGQQGDCMYFIAAGEVEVDLPGGIKVPLGEGAFFGEMALLGNTTRNANITTTRVSRLLVLDLVDFRLLMARHPELAGDHRRGSEAARAGKQIRRDSCRTSRARARPCSIFRAPAPPSASTGRNITTGWRPKTSACC